MIFKSYILEQNLQTVDKYKTFLFYGENQGLKKEFKEKLKLHYKNSEVINLYQDEIIKNKNILINEITTGSLFVNKKVILINEATDKIVEVLIELIELIQEEKIFIFSDALDKRSKLRNLFEKTTTCVVVPCYQDNEITIKRIISSGLKNYSGLTPNVVNLIVQNTNLDRNKVNNEIDKIKSCFTERKIDQLKLISLLNIKTNDDFNLLKDEALNGNKIKTNRLLADTVFESENNVYYLNLINQRILKLKQLESLKNDNNNIESAIDDLKPPVFWKDKPVLIEQSMKWTRNKIQIALEKTFNTEIKIKSNSSLRKDILIKNLILDLCVTANS
jgi:DNA polymerase-3 subunit delta